MIVCDEDSTVRKMNTKYNDRRPDGIAVAAKQFHNAFCSTRYFRGHPIVKVIVHWAPVVPHVWTGNYVTVSGVFACVLESICMDLCPRR